MPRGTVVNMGERKGAKRAATSRSVAGSLDEPGRFFAACRALGHEWRHMGQVADSGYHGAIGYQSNCSHCGTVRTKWVTRSGELFSPRYQYPDGYSRHGEERLSTKAWRREWVVSLLEATA
jgi:hypothetical protein